MTNFPYCMCHESLSVLCIWLFDVFFVCVKYLASVRNWSMWRGGSPVSFCRASGDADAGARQMRLRHWCIERSRVGLIGAWCRLH